MKIEITEQLQEKINSMILLAKELSVLRNDYPACYKILIEQFLPERSYGTTFIKDKEENTKIRLYAEVMKRDYEFKAKVEKSIVESK